MSSSLWPNGISIPVIGITGGHGSGKTTFALSIFPKGTLCCDLECGAIGWEHTGLERIDFASVLLKQYPNGAMPRQLFQLWLESMRAIPAGKYAVIVTDPADRLETGLVDYIKHKHSDYGFKSPETFAATGGVMQSYCNSFWEQTLLEVASRCECFCFCNHTKQGWNESLRKSTGPLIPRGRGAFYQLASLYLFLDREPRADGTAPKAPSARVLEDRLCHKSLNDGVLTIQPYLPVRLPVATPNTIRHYILNPANYDVVPEEERVKDKELTEGQKMEFQASIAADERASMEAKLEAAKIDSAIAEANRVARERAQSQSKERRPINEEPDRMEIEKPLTDDEALDLLSAAKAIGMFCRVNDGIDKMLRRRGVEPAAANIERVKQLTRAEYGQFMKGIALEAASKLKGS